MGNSIHIFNSEGYQLIEELAYGIGDSSMVEILALGLGNLLWLKLKVGVRQGGHLERVSVLLVLVIG